MKRILISGIFAALVSLAVGASSAQAPEAGVTSAVERSSNAEAREALLLMHEDLQRDLALLEALYAETSRRNEELAARVYELEQQSSDCISGIQARGDVAGTTGNATEDPKTTPDKLNGSYNLQYLQLQQKMQQDNRQFTTVSNIMKTKHDTAKATINNIR